MQSKIILWNWVMRLGKFGKLKTWWGRPEGWRLRKRVTFESKGSLLTNQEELVLHIKPRGILLPEFSLALRDISLLFYSGLQLIRWGPSTLWRAIYFIQRLKCKSHPKTPTKKDSESVQFSSVTQSCLTLCNPMNCSMPGLPVHHQFPESTQTHIHRVDDAIQPPHPLSSPSPPALNLS